MLGCSGHERQSDVVLEHPFLIGNWSGEGHFLDIELDKEIGKVWVEFEILPDNSVRGKIGEARLVDTEIYPASYGFEIAARLDAPIKKGVDLDKDYLYILLVIPDNKAGNISSSDANFHLKSNTIFDFSMRVGGVTLKKASE